MCSLLLSTNVLVPRILRPLVQRANASTNAATNAPLKASTKGPSKSPVKATKVTEFASTKASPKAPVKNTKVNEGQQQVLTEDSSAQQVATARRLQQLADSNNLSFDIWSFPPPLLDLRVPAPVFQKGTSIKQIWRNFEYNFANSVSNTINMYQIAKSHSLPWDPEAKAVSMQIFRATSAKPNTWLSPLREIALETYKDLNSAVASNRGAVIEHLSTGNYKKRLLERMKVLNRSRGRTRLEWQLHSLASPVQCVSIRAQQGHMGKKELIFGTRFFVQACMKFDTWQSISASDSSVLSSVEPKRVVEYLVFEKRMWYDEPWAVRDQIWPGAHLNQDKRTE